MVNMAYRLFKRMALFCLPGVFALMAPALMAADKAASENLKTTERHKPARLSIEGISASAGEDEPRVLTILPWRAPTLPRRPRAELESAAPELVEPVDAFVLERHRIFRQSLGVATPDDQPGARR